MDGRMARRTIDDKGTKIDKSKIGYPVGVNPKSKAGVIRSGPLDQTWDVLVIGGGITGAAILREATRAGLRALLVEQRDFSSGTSSRSTKLVHGGFRYLSQGQLRVVRDSVRQRQRLLARRARPDRAGRLHARALSRRSPWPLALPHGDGAV